ncbi:hypothetical protein [Limosilactobacillus reuteri]|uniref:hypothetical protein n=1 Tax=Limosilactobacillus reuteri TaxID=1598 RepID=UPI001E63DA16|nr:hypothetical protein [Limosilactobacillus reuteri]MCC4346153.1 hypothetical protein [Limosilactobacillus reuteri]MCC4432110.1 hypothetical protein [Limosilactobacillus reuteri]MCC4434262.1 hypothetical protein [Limosilactobacillus reuteri]
MAKKITDKDGNVYVQKKAWYKRWWVWVIIAIVALILIGSLSGNSSNSKAGSGSGSNTQISSPSKITVDYDDYNVKSSKTYKVDYSNNDWDEADVKINKVTVYKLAKPYKFDSANDGKYDINGFIKLDMTIKANGDISIYPQQGTAVIGSEQEEAVGESWDGDINKGAEKSGEVYIPVKDLEKTTSISNIRFKFSGNDQNDMESDHDYDLTLNLDNN